MRFDPTGLLTLGLGAAVALGVFLFARRYGGGAAMGVLSQANTILEKRIAELEALHRRDQQTIALLDARTSLEPMVAAVVTQFGEHERRAQKRHDQAMVVWGLIADRLGADPEPDSVA